MELWHVTEGPLVTQKSTEHGRDTQTQLPEVAPSGHGECLSLQQANRVTEELKSLSCFSPSRCRKATFSVSWKEVLPNSKVRFSS